MRLKTFIISFFVVLTISSCQKSDNSSGNPPDNKPEPIVTSKVNVYTAGYVDSKAAYWKNEVLNIVNDDGKTSKAVAIAVQGSDVYLAGTTITPPDITATYWKNGVPTYLSKVPGDITGIAVRGNDVYVIGRTERIINSVQGYCATLWKNGVLSYLTDNLLSFANGITITDKGDIYIAGRIDSRACYWKNGSLVYVGDINVSSSASAICISGTDVYLTGLSYENTTLGYSRPAAVYWKNGVQTKLPVNGTPGSSSGASISVNGTNIYVVGSASFDGPPAAFFKAIYWKNGVYNDISATNDSKVSYGAGAVAATEDEVYIAAAMSNKAYFLKNGVQTTLNANGAISFSYAAICLVPK